MPVISPNAAKVAKATNNGNVSKHSKKAGRPVVQRDPATYFPKVKTYQQLLRTAGTGWDETRGEEHIISISLALRVLLVDGLVDKVQALKRLLFVDTAFYPPAGGGEFIGGGLTVSMLGSDESKVAALCEVGDTDQIEYPVRLFPRWWDKDEAVRHGSDAFTRRFLVYEAANTDGVHIDPELDADYDRIMGAVPNMSFGTPAGEQLPVTGVAAASLRQIAWEVDRSLTANLALHDIAGPPE